MVYPIAVGGAKTQDDEMSEQAQRRRFTAAYKLKIVQDADRRTQPGCAASGGAAPRQAVSHGSGCFRPSTPTKHLTVHAAEGAIRACPR